MNFQDFQQYLAMVQDRPRCEAYERAIARTVAGKVVLDLGSGPGFLSHLALKHGAAKVYAIEADPQALGLATELARRFPQPERFVPILGHSLALQLPERVDVIVSEILDSTGIGENAHVAMADAARRFLVPGGILIPHTLELFLGLGVSGEARSIGQAWEHVGADYGLPYESFDGLLGGIGLCVSCADLVTGDQTNGGTGWVHWQTVDLAKNDFHLHTVVPMRATRAGPVRGIANAWRAHLLDDIVLESLPEAPETHWKQGFFNIGQAVDAEAGDQFIFEIMFADSRDSRVAFNMRLHHAPAAERESLLARLPDWLRSPVEEGRVAVVDRRDSAGA